MMFQMEYYLCKEYPAFTPISLRNETAEDIFNLYTDTYQINQELEEIRQYQTGEKEQVIRRRASDSAGWW